MARRGAVAPPARERNEPAKEAATAARWARVTEIVGGALERPDARERRRYLRSACAGDRELRREVEALLRFEDADSGILAGPLLGERADPGDETPAAVKPALEAGQEIGSYRVERLLGEGGMGVVALAYDPELDRRVALKLLRREGAGEELPRRFETERRVLARLDHPHIARIFDAGTAGAGDDRQPYFAMEYVEGEPIDAWCDRRKVPVEGRLRLVLEVCDALAEAHRGLVVHRDLKPGNILVTAAGEPKILDFGIAKELDPLAGADLTRAGGQPLTPAYASPEQVRGRPVTVASDVYSLGCCSIACCAAIRPTPSTATSWRTRAGYASRSRRRRARGRWWRSRCGAAGRRSRCRRRRSPRPAARRPRPCAGGCAAISTAQALGVRLAAAGPRSTGVASALGLLGRVQHAQGRLEEAAESLAQALDVRLEVLGADHLHVALTRKDLASVRLELGDVAAAEALWAQAMRVLRAAKPAGSWELADADSQLGGRLAAAGQLEEAEPSSALRNPRNTPVRPQPIGRQTGR